MHTLVLAARTRHVITQRGDQHEVILLALLELLCTVDGRLQAWRVQLRIGGRLGLHKLLLVGLNDLDLRRFGCFHDRSILSVHRHADRLSVLDCVSQLAEGDGDRLTACSACQALRRALGAVADFADRRLTRFADLFQLRPIVIRWLLLPIGWGATVGRARHWHSNLLGRAHGVRERL